MFLRGLRFSFTLMLAAALATGCVNPEKKKREKEKAQRIKEYAAANRPKIPNMNQDTTFQAFLGRLRIAAAKRDRAMMASMMTQNFGYRWDPPASPAETAFDYWDQNNLWPQLERTLQGVFSVKGGYMVTPVEFVADPDYSGYRAGIRLDNGAWRFAYFISGQDPMPE